MNTTTESRPHSGERWDAFARKDPYSYIMTDLPSGNSDVFWESGERTVAQELIPLLESYTLERGTVMEIGCGVGRLILPLSRHFCNAIGVDISTEMLSRARLHSNQRSANNVRFVLAKREEGLCSIVPDLIGSVDFAYSLLVLQHVEHFSIIREYMLAIASFLAPGGMAYLQFDTRKSNWLYSIRAGIPELLLPRNWRKGIRRIRRTPDEIRHLFERCGLRIAQERGISSEYHCFVLAKHPCPSKE